MIIDIENMLKYELTQIEKPARYIGKEINMCVKNAESVDIRFGFCFPDTYEIGMSHLGLSILYSFLNRRNDTYCERFFAPWTDMEKLIREKDIPLFSLETQTDGKSFDFLGFTLQYEMSYTNILNMLDLAKIPLLASERSEDTPIICAGGPCAYNPEPLADFFDFFYLGEGEDTLDKVMDIYAENKKSGGTKLDFLKKIVSVRGIYIPQFYDVVYNDNGTISKFKKNYMNAPDTIEKAIVPDLNNMFFPESQIVPYLEVVHDRVALELFRGCIRGCRFCQAGFVYRPVREKKHETLSNQARKLMDATGHEEISLVSLSTSDYSQFRALAETLVDEYCGQGVNLSLPSLRIDAFTLELMEKAQGVRKSSLTFAPEAGTQRLRDVVNKNLTEKDILNGCKLAFSGGWDRIKLYFMIGLPTETDEDLMGITSLGNDIISEYYKQPKEKRRRPVNITISSSCFVPKPFTPFQWDSQNTIDEFSRKQSLLKNNINKKNIKFSYHHPDVSVLEGLFARGDRRVAKTLIRAFNLGARFDGWSELFNFSVWKQAIDETGLDLDFYTGRKRGFDEILPWDHISVGVDKLFLIRERDRAENAKTTPDCRTGCTNCGAKSFGGGVCYE